MSMDATEAPTAEAEDQPAVDTTGAPSPGEETSAPEVETPEFFSDQFDPDSLDEPLQQRYKQMHADYTRKTQQLAQQRQEVEQHQMLLQALQSDDPQLQAQALEALGLEFADDDEDPYGDPDLEEVDPLDELHDEVARLKADREQELAARQQQQQVQQIEQHMDQQFADLAKREGRQLSEKEKLALSVLAGFVVDSTDASGLPDMNAAYEWLSGLREEWRQGYVTSKQAPRVASSGQPGSPSFNFDDENERVSALASVLERNGEFS